MPRFFMKTSENFGIALAGPSRLGRRTRAAGPSSGTVRVLPLLTYLQLHGHGARSDNCGSLEPSPVHLLSSVNLSFAGGKGRGGREKGTFDGSSARHQDCASIGAMSPCPGAIRLAERAHGPLSLICLARGPSSFVALIVDCGLESLPVLWSIDLQADLQGGGRGKEPHCRPGVDNLNLNFIKGALPVSIPRPHPSCERAGLSGCSEQPESARGLPERESSLKERRQYSRRKKNSSRGPRRRLWARPEYRLLEHRSFRLPLLFFRGHWPSPAPSAGVH